MVNPWRKYKEAPIRKQQTLRSVIVGFVAFCALYAVSELVSIPLCLFRNLFKIPCPGCGLTRGFIALLHMNLREATKHNPFTIPLFLGILFYSVLSVTDILWERNDVERLECACKKWYVIAAFAILYLIHVFRAIF